jgi:S-methylmethionine-dependent homocysteine/selenocysteine methylase
MIFLDGGIGSEMDLRVPKQFNDDPGWCACHHLTNSNVLKKVHEDFVISGSQMISANTYSILKYLLKTTDDFIKDSVEKAVRLAEEVRSTNPDLLIAGCLSAHGCHDHSDEDVRDSLVLLASCLASTSIDCILVEMVQNRHIGKMMVYAADASNLPLIIGFSVIRDGGKLKLKTKDVEFTPDVVRYILSDANHIKLVGVMHSSVNVIDEALSVIENVWDGGTIAYPDCGTFKNNMWSTSETGTNTSRMAQTLLDCKKKHPKLRVVGGCCGLGPSFIRELRAVFESHSETLSPSMLKKYLIS